MIDTRKLKELVRLMVENELSELDLRDQEETVTIKRGSSGPPVIMHQPAMAAPVAAAPATATDNGEPKAEPSDDAGLITIESPMVGTFYAKPNPESDAFASVGTAVGTGTVVCIVEAMKVFNEIKSEVNGTIERVCAADGDAVEFGQKLFLVRPA